MSDATLPEEEQLKEQLIRASAKMILAFILFVLSTAFLSWPRKANTVRKLLIKDRRSTVKYSGPATEGSVTRALEAAIHAPNHFLNEPWRFRLLGPQTVGEIKACNEAKRELFDGVPGWMMVSVVPTAGDGKWHLKSLEDHAATACAVQNFMLSLAGEGYASKWMTGAMGIPPSKLMEIVGADEAKEHFMGIIFFGKPTTVTSDTPAPKRKQGLDEPILQNLP